MHELTGNQEAVLEVLRQTIYHLGQDTPRSRERGTRALGVKREGQWSAQRDEIIDRLQRSYEREQDKAVLTQAVAPAATRSRSRAAAPPAMPSQSTTKEWYMPPDRTIAVFQAAMDEFLEEHAPKARGAGKAKSATKTRSRGAAGSTPDETMSADKHPADADMNEIKLFFRPARGGKTKTDDRRTRASFEQYDTLDPRWIEVVWEKAKSMLTGKARFISHKAKTDFRFPLADKATIALVADWGGGNTAARLVAEQIKSRRPDHVIHLGDVYYAGTEREIRERFFALWDFWSTPVTAGRSFALNSNHEMYGGGHGYFKHTLKTLKQPASYFAFGNSNWRLIGLDTGYVDHDLNREQIDWLGGQLTGSAKTVLLSHHQPFSAFSREDGGEKLRSRVRPFLDGGKIYGWFWGHEHLCVKYGKHEGIKGRCIGHGCIPYDIPEVPAASRVPVEWMNTRRLPTADNQGMHGFALLTIDGANMQVEYIDRDGVVSNTEDF